MQYSLMIFAAGFGTRMGEMTRTLPKPMLPLGGDPMIDKTIEIARDAGVSNIVANVHYLTEKIQPHLEEKCVRVLVEDGEILDTGGGLKAARHHLSSPTFTLNPDTVWQGPNPLTYLADAWRDEDEALLLVVPLARAENREGLGDFDLTDGHLTRGKTYIYTGAQLIRTGVLEEVDAKVFSLNRTWDRIAKRKKLRGVEYPGTWIDVGTAEGLSVAQKMVEHGNI